MSRLVLISDTHSRHESLVVPDGDILVHSGDLTMEGTVVELKAAAKWMRSLPHCRKVFIAGNHDWALQHLMTNEREDLIHTMFDGCDYLRDSSVNINGLNFYGSPWQPVFNDWAFNLTRGPKLMDKWEMIHHSTDVLVTHGPPLGVLDKCDNGHVGCYDLGIRVREVRPVVHVFGHIHSGYGHDTRHGTDFYNASVVNERYKVTNEPWVVDLEKK